MDGAGWKLVDGRDLVLTPPIKWTKTQADRRAGRQQTPTDSEDDNDHGAMVLLVLFAPQEWGA